MASDATTHAPLPLVEWINAAVPARAGVADSVAATLVQEDFTTVQEVCGQSGPNAGDLAELFPEQETIQTALMQAIENRQSMEAWLRDHLPPEINPAGCADTLQREDFMSLADLVSASLNATDMAELFPDEPAVASRLLDALGKSTAHTIAAAAPALTLPLASVSEQSSVATSNAASDSLEAWLRARLPSVDASASMRTFHREGFMNVDEVLSAGITRADLDELFPEWDPSTLARLFEIIAEDGFTRKTPTEETARTTPVLDGGRTAPYQRSVTQQDALRQPADRGEPKQNMKGKRHDDVKRSNHSVGVSDAVMKRLPSSKLTGRPSVGTKIFVEFDDCCYKGKVVSHSRDNAGLFDCYFEEDDETWTLDANRHRYCLDNIGMERKTERRRTESTDTTSSSPRAGAKKTSKKRQVPDSDMARQTARHKTQSTDITSCSPRAAAKKTSKKRKVPGSDSDDDPLTFKRKTTPAVYKQQRMSPRRESLLECANTSPNIHRIIAQNAPLYNGSKDMLIRKLGSHISSQQPPGHDVWDAKSIGTAISEMCHYEIQQHKWLLKESFCFFLTKAERRSLGYKRGILKGGANSGNSTDSDGDAARSAVQSLTLPSIHAPGNDDLTDTSPRGLGANVEAQRRPSAAKNSCTQEPDQIVRCLFRSSSPLGLDFRRTDDGDSLKISSIATGSSSASIPGVRVGLILHEIQGRLAKRSRAEQQLKELSKLAKTRPLALAFKVPVSWS